MKKDFHIFNDIEIDLDEFEEVELNELEKKRMIKKAVKDIKVKKTGKKAIVAVVASIAMISVLALGNEGVYAKLLSEVESFFYKSSEELEPYRIGDNNVTVKSLEEHGLKVNISDVILDDMYLLVKVNIDWSEVDLAEYGLTEEDRDRVQFTSLGQFELFSGDKVISKKRSIYSEVKEGSKSTQSIRIEYKAGDIDLNKKSKVKLCLDDVVINVKSKENKNEFEPSKHTNGEWNFEVDIDGRELQKNLKVVDINKKQNFENEFFEGALLIKQYRQSPISGKIVFQSIINKDNNPWIGHRERSDKSPWYEFNVEFYDENNTKIELNWVASNDERTILEIRDYKEYKKIKIISEVIEYREFERKDGIVVKSFEPIVVNLQD